MKTALELIEKELEKFDKELPIVQDRVRAALLKFLKEFELEGDNLKNSVKNIRLIAETRSVVERALFQSDYETAVKDFLISYSAIATIQNDYFSSLTKQFKKKPLFEEIKKNAIRMTADQLTSNGVASAFSSSVESILSTAIAEGASYAKLSQQLIETISEKDDVSKGLLKKYAGQVAVDAINTFSRNYSAAVTADLRIEWYEYQGSNIRSTRQWCLAMTKKRFVHVSEFTTVINDRVDNIKVGSDELKVNARTNLPQGMIEGTDAQNLKSNAGGWQCGHSFTGITENRVPKDIVNRVKNSEEYKRWKQFN